MVNRNFCPLCSFRLSGPDIERCPKCKVMLAEEWKRKESYEAQLQKKSETVQGPFHPVIGLKCPLCSEGVEIQAVQIEEYIVNGEKLGDSPIGPMYAPNRCIVAFQAWRCRKDHRMFSSFETEWIELCPKCMTRNSMYGKLVRSCSACKTMVPVDFYRTEDPLKLMESRGWTYAPDLEK
ncbi:MAG: hypothetical protein JW939_07450 [Candidatus Thermoplasmatota archaeon]|nr:hypothetical protein [Candidatus Thermoplasmatota archaeon]